MKKECCTMKKPSPVAEQTRQNLIQAFWKCYAKAPLSEVTVKEIAEVAGYNRTTFYQYFDNVPDLMDAAEEKLFRELVANVNTAIAEGLTLPALEKSLERCIDQYGDQLKILLGPASDSHFYTRFKETLKPLTYFDFNESKNSLDIDLICEFVTSDLITVIAYLSSHPEADRKKVIHKLHDYIHGGVSQLTHTMA
ncbi:MAG: TetR/AcrR family transcriptional regulator [Pseudoramibacter sp.]